MAERALDLVSLPGAQASVAEARPWRPGRRSLWVASFPLLLVAVFFILPLGMMIVQSLHTDASHGNAYARTLNSPAVLSSLLYTFTVALSVTALALLLSYPVAFFVAKARGSLFKLAMALILIPFWTSTVIRTYAWVVLMQRRGVLNELLLASGLIDQPLRLIGSNAGTEVAMVHLMLPLMLLPLLNAMRGIDPVYLRAAAVLGANPLKQFIHVYFPMTLAGVSAGCTLVFISALGFYVTPAMLGGSSSMVAVLIEQQASRLLDWPAASALGTLLLVLTCALFVVYERAVGGRRRAG